MITITRILPTKVMVPSYQSEGDGRPNHPRDVSATSRKWDGAWTVCVTEMSRIRPRHALKAARFSDPRLLF